MYFYSPIMEDNDVYPEQEMDEASASAVAQTTNNNKRGYHRWNSLTKVKNKLNSLSKGMYYVNNVVISFISSNLIVLDHVKTTTTAIFTQNEKESFFEDVSYLYINYKIIMNDINFFTIIISSFSLNV